MENTIRKINSNTNSYYTEEEYKTLTDLGFSWSNRSGEYDNALYQYKNGISYDIMATSNGLSFEKHYPTLFGMISYYDYNSFIFGK